MGAARPSSALPCATVAVALACGVLTAVGLVFVLNPGAIAGEPQPPRPDSPPPRQRWPWRAPGHGPNATATAVARSLPLFERRMRSARVSMSLAMVAGGAEFVAAVGANPRTRRPLTPADTMLFGSGTKSFVGARVMQLVQSGHLRMDEPVGPHIDPMVRAWGQAHGRGANMSWVGLFTSSARDREWAALVTVGSCIRMQSGLADWDQPGPSGLDDALLRSLAHTPNKLWSPLLFLNFTASAQPSAFWFKPGAKTAYTSTGYQVVGLVLAAVEARLRGEAGGEGAPSWESLDLRHVFGNAAETRYPSSNFCERWLLGSSSFS